MGHGKLGNIIGKVMESHGISKAQKSMNLRHFSLFT